MSHFSLPLTRLVHENLSIVMCFAYSRKSLSKMVEGNKFMGEWKYLNKALFVNRPGFNRHLEALKLRQPRRCHEQQALCRRIQCRLGHELPESIGNPRRLLPSWGRKRLCAWSARWLTLGPAPTLRIMHLLRNLCFEHFERGGCVNRNMVATIDVRKHGCAIL